jgi:hypothetical protein
MFDKEGTGELGVGGNGDAARFDVNLPKNEFLGLDGIAGEENEFGDERTCGDCGRDEGGVVEVGVADGDIVPNTDPLGLDLERVGGIYWIDDRLLADGFAESKKSSSMEGLLAPTESSPANKSSDLLKKSEKDTSDALLSDGFEVSETDERAGDAKEFNALLEGDVAAVGEVIEGDANANVAEVEVSGLAVDDDVGGGS